MAHTDDNRGAQVATPEFMEEIREASGVPIAEDDGAAIHAVARDYGCGGPTPAQHRQHLEAIAHHAEALHGALNDCGDYGLHRIIDTAQLERLRELARSNADRIQPRQGRRTDTALRELALQCLHAYWNAGGTGLGVGTNWMTGEREGRVLSLITAALRHCGAKHVPSDSSIRTAIQAVERQGKK